MLLLWCIFLTWKRRNKKQDGGLLCTLEITISNDAERSRVGKKIFVLLEEITISLKGERNRVRE